MGNPREQPKAPEGFNWLAQAETSERWMMFHRNAKRWMKELTELRDTLERGADLISDKSLAGKLSNVILEMSEDYYGEPRNGVYEDE